MVTVGRVRLKHLDQREKGFSLIDGTLSAIIWVNVIEPSVDYLQDDAITRMAQTECLQLTFN